MIKLVAGLACAVACAQTTITLDQIRPAAAGADLQRARVLVEIDGKLLPAALGPGLTLSRTTDGKVVINAPSATVILPPFMIDVACSRSATDGSYQPAEAPPPGFGTMVVYRNGVRMRGGTDYTVMSPRTIRPVQPWPADSIVSVDYYP